MSLSIGIVGLPNVGKSTLFKAITKKQVDTANYPFCTIDPNVGVVLVPDPRVDRLAALLQSAKKIYAPVEFVDIAGLVAGAHKGEGLGNQFLAHVRETDVLVYVLRCFRNEKIINTQKKINVLRDKEILDTEMALKDLATLEKRTVGLEKEARAGSKDAQREIEAFGKAKHYLEKGALLTVPDFSIKELQALKSYQLLATKPRLYLLNGTDGETAPAEKIFGEQGWPCLTMDIPWELEAADFSRKEREAFGLEVETQLDVLIQRAYQLLNLITFFTAGEKETRAWNLPKGSRAPQAGGAIHSDFEKNFIRAEVIAWQDLLDCGGYVQAREKGLIRTEGKDYVVQDGDVIEIKSGA